MHELPTNLPPLTTLQARALEVYLTSSAPIPTLAREADLSLPIFLDTLALPEVRAHIDHIRRLSRDRAEIAIAEATQTAAQARSRAHTQPPPADAASRAHDTQRRLAIQAIFHAFDPRNPPVREAREPSRIPDPSPRRPRALDSHANFVRRPPAPRAPSKRSHVEHAPTSRTRLDMKSVHDVERPSTSICPEIRTHSNAHQRSARRRSHRRWCRRAGDPLLIALARAPPPHESFHDV